MGFFHDLPRHLEDPQSMSGVNLLSTVAHVSFQAADDERQRNQPSYAFICPVLEGR
jgi:hypothetical protein